MKTRFRALLICVLALVISEALLGQGLTGSIVGTITDPSDAVVPHARITIKNVNTNAEIGTTTDVDGFYRAVGLVPGDYSVKAEAPGFRQVTTSPQAVAVATPVRVDLRWARLRRSLPSKPRRHR